MYAIEASSLSEMTQKIVDANGMEDKITVISKKVEVSEQLWNSDLHVDKLSPEQNTQPFCLFTRNVFCALFLQIAELPEQVDVIVSEWMVRVSTSS